MKAFFYGTNIQIEVFDIVVGADSEFDLTCGKPYVVREINGTDLITVKNDTGKLECYSTECFKKYNGERIL